MQKIWTNNIYYVALNNGSDVYPMSCIKSSVWFKYDTQTSENQKMRESLKKILVKNCRHARACKPENQLSLA